LRYVSKNKVLYLIIYITIAIVLSYVIYMPDLETNSINSFTVLSIVAIFQLMLTLYYFKIFKIRIFSPIGLFTIFLFLFSFGQVLLKGLLSNYEFQLFDLSKFVSHYSLISVIRYSLIIIFLFTLGALLSSVNTKSVETKKENLHDKQYKYCKPIGLALLLISVPPMMYIDIKTIQASFSGGYHSIFYLGIPSIYGSLADFFLPAVILLLFYYKKNISICRFILVFSVAYKLFTMLGGQRGYAMIFIITLIYIYYKSIESISIFNKIKYWVGGLLVLAFLNTIKDIRGIQDKGLSLIIESFNYAISNNIVFRAFEEFGSTLFTNVLVFDYYPKVLTHLYGISYLASIFTILPNIGGIVTHIVDKYRWAEQLSMLQPGIGGSFIGELYVNFGYSSFFIAIVIGWILCRLSKKYEQAIICNDYFSVAIYSITFCYSLLWVRGSFEMLVRSTVWTLLTVYGLYMIFKGISRKT